MASGSVLLSFPPEFSVEDICFSLPKWLASANLNSEIRRQAFIYKTLSGLLGETSNLSEQMNRVAEGYCLNNTATPRLVWECFVGQTQSNNPLVTLQLDGDAATVVRKAVSSFDFLDTVDPVYILSDDHRMLLRNLGRVYETIYSDSASSFKYTAETMVPDEEVLVQQVGGGMGRIPEESVDRETSKIYIEYPYKYNIAYTSEASVALLSAAGSAYLYVDDLPPKSLSIAAIWNLFDEAALLCGLTRLPGETNSALKSRITQLFIINSFSAQNTLPMSIGDNLGVVGVVSWDGSGTLDFASQGITGVRSLVIGGDLPRVKMVSAEVLVPNSSNTIYSSSTRTWDAGYIVYADGMPITSTTYPGMAVGDGKVVFPNGVNARLLATYSYTNYNITYDGEYITALVATDNTKLDNYQVVYCCDLDLHSANDPIYVEGTLIQENGLPSLEFVQLVDAIRQEIPITIGSVEWGKGAYWFDDLEVAPGLSNMPLLLK